MCERAVIFDMDGVLVDSYRPHWLSWVESCDARGIAITEAQYAALFGRSFRGFVEALCETVPGTDEFERWYDEKEAAYRRLVEADFPEMPGAGDLIVALAGAGFALGIASSGPRANVDCLLRHLPGAGLFAATISANEVPRAKPNPDPFLACARALGVHPVACVVVEDSLHGLQGARAAGMKTFGLTSTCPRDTLLPHADRLVNSLRELAPRDFVGLLTDGHAAQG